MVVSTITPSLLEYPATSCFRRIVFVGAGCALIARSATNPTATPRINTNVNTVVLRMLPPLFLKVPSMFRLRECGGTEKAHHEREEDQAAGFNFGPPTAIDTPPSVKAPALR